MNESEKQYRSSSSEGDLVLEIIPRFADYLPTSDDLGQLDRLTSRGHVVREIISTERDFVEDMKVLIEIYLIPLQETGIISQNECWMLFGPIEDILKVNQEILRRLEARWEATKAENKTIDEMILGDIFRDMAELLQTYKLYCCNQKVAFAFLEDVKLGNPDFVIFLEECRTNPRCRQTDLLSWLIKPLQRLCKYPLLLKEMIAHTPPESEDASFLTEAAEKIQFTVSFVNRETQKAEEEVESERKLLSHIESIIMNEGVDLSTKAGRKLIKTGGLDIICGKKHQKRYPMSAFLFSDLFVVTCLNVNGKKPKKNHHKILLRNLQITLLSDDYPIPNCLSLQDIEQGKSIILSFLSLDLKEEWLLILRDMVKDYQKQRALRQMAMTKLSDSDKKVPIQKKASLATLHKVPPLAIDKTEGQVETSNSKKNIKRTLSISKLQSVVISPREEKTNNTNTEKPATTPRDSIPEDSSPTPLLTEHLPENSELGRHRKKKSPRLDFSPAQPLTGDGSPSPRVPPPKFSPRDTGSIKLSRTRRESSSGLGRPKPKSEILSSPSSDRGDNIPNADQVSEKEDQRKPFKKSASVEHLPIGDGDGAKRTFLSLSGMKRIYDDPKHKPRRSFRASKNNDLLQDYLTLYDQKISSHDRARLIRELTNNEADFVRDIETITEVFVEPLDYSEILSRSELWLIFGPLQEMKKFCETHSTPYFQTSHESIDIGAAFLAIAANLFVFEDYCTNRCVATSLIDFHEANNPNFVRFLVDCMLNPRCRNQSLIQWLLGPVAHVYQYQMLAKELLALPDPNMPNESKNLTVALEIINKFIDTIEKKSQETINKFEEQQHQLSRLEKRLEWTGETDRVYFNASLCLSDFEIRICLPGRELIKEGPCCKLETERDKKKKLKMKLVLCNDILLLLSKQEKSKKLTVSQLIYSKNVLQYKNDVEEDCIIIYHLSQASPNTDTPPESPKVSKFRVRHETYLYFDKDSESWLALLSTSRTYHLQHKLKTSPTLETRKSRPESYSWTKSTLTLASPTDPLKKPKKLKPQKLKEGPPQRLSLDEVSSSIKKGKAIPRSTHTLAQLKEDCHSQFEAIWAQLLTDEESFLSLLGIITEDLQEPLKLNQLLSKNDIWNLFGNVSQISSLHKLFIESVRAATADTKTPKFDEEKINLWIELIIASTYSFLPVYEVYLKNISGSLLHYEHLSKAPEHAEFAQWLSVTLKEIPHCAIPFTELIQAPSSRISSYAKWIQSFLGCFAVPSPEVSEALQKLTQLLLQIQSEKKQFTRSTWNLITLEKRFRNTLDLVATHRRLALFNDFITLVSGTDSKMVSIFIFNDILVLADQVGINYSIFFKCSLKEQLIFEATNSEDPLLSLIRMEASDQTFVLGFETETQRDHYLQHVSKVTHRFRRMSLKKYIGLSAQWQDAIFQDPDTPDQQ